MSLAGEDPREVLDLDAEVPLQPVKINGVVKEVDFMVPFEIIDTRGTEIRAESPKDNDEWISIYDSLQEWMEGIWGQGEVSRGQVIQFYNHVCAWWEDFEKKTPKHSGNSQGSSTTTQALPSPTKISSGGSVEPLNETSEDSKQNE